MEFRNIAVYLGMIQLSEHIRTLNLKTLPEGEGERNTPIRRGAPLLSVRDEDTGIELAFLSLN